MSIKSVLDRLSRQLTSDGRLILGAAESAMGVTDVLERRRNCRASGYAAKPRHAVNASSIAYVSGSGGTPRSL